MNRRRLLDTAAFLSLALVATACSTTLGPVPAPTATGPVAERGTLRIVGVLPMRLNPPHLVVGSEERIGWLNYTNRAIRISLEPSALWRLRCEGGGGLDLEGAQLSSGRVDRAYFETGCRLAPGEYSYRVERLSSTGEAPEVIYGSLVVVPQAALAQSLEW